MGAKSASLRHPAAVGAQGRMAHHLHSLDAEPAGQRRAAKRATGRDAESATRESSLQTQLQISFRNMESSPTAEEHVRERVAKLEHFYDRVVACRVVIEQHHRHQQQGRLFHVRVDVSIPGRTIVVNRDPAEHHAHEDCLVAIRDAFDAAERLLEDHAKRMHGQVKTHVEPGSPR